MLQRLINWFRKKPTIALPKEDLNIYEELDELLKLVATKKIELTPGLPGLGTIWSYVSDLGELELFLRLVNKDLQDGIVVNTAMFKPRKEEIDLDYFLFTRKGKYAKNQHEDLESVLKEARRYHTFVKDGFSARLGAQENNHRKLYAFTISLNVVLRALLVYAR